MKARNPKTKNKESGNLVSVFIIIVAILIFISLVSQKTMGLFGDVVNTILCSLFGSTAFVFPLLLLIYVYSTFNKSKELYKKIIPVIVMIISSIIFQLIDINGGWVGKIISKSMNSMFGSMGSIFILFMLLITLLLKTTNISIIDVSRKIKNVKLKRNSPIPEPEVKKTESLKINIPNRANFVDKNVINTTKDIPKKITKIQLEKPNNVIPISIKKDVKNETLILPACIEGYKLPYTTLLNSQTKKQDIQLIEKNVSEGAKILEETLKSFKIDAPVKNATCGSVVTRYEIQIPLGLKLSKITSLADDISLRLASHGVRIEAIHGKPLVGIEVPNKEVKSILLRELIESKEYQNFNSKLAFVVGEDITGKSIVADVSKMPHILIAGATGSGKSVCINSLILSILFKSSPKEVKFIMIDPKMVELGVYNGIPHLMMPVVTEAKKAAGALNFAVNEMVDRYKKFAEAGVRDIKGYNTKFKVENPEKTLSEVVIIVDELADLMMVAPDEVEDAICRLAQMARAAGMYLIIATQRPSVDVITGVIKANIPSRISFAVASQIDSRTILDMGGAEKLLGKGDMLYYPVGEPKPIRIKGAFISDKEVERVVDFVKKQSKSENKLLLTK